MTRLLARSILVAMALVVMLPSWAASQADSRGVSLSKPRNMRQLGGLPAQGGTVRRGMIYRSAHLHYVPKADQPTLEGLRLQTLIDLRMPMETALQGRDARKLRKVVPNRAALPMINGLNPNAAYYRELLGNAAARKSMVRFFGILASKANYPVLFHCAFGKDRTGVMSALLLMALGTPRDAITADYMMSPGVRAEWLQAVYQEVDAAGGIEPFLLKVGVQREVLAAVRSNLVGTEPAP